MNKDYKTLKDTSYFKNTIKPCIITPSTHDTVGRLKKCACGIPTNDKKCGVCHAEERAGISLRVVKKA